MNATLDGAAPSVVFESGVAPFEVEELLDKLNPAGILKATQLPAVLPAVGGLPKQNPVLAPLGLDPKFNLDGEAKAPPTAPVLALAPVDGLGSVPSFSAVHATQAIDSTLLLVKQASQSHDPGLLANFAATVEPVLRGPAPAVAPLAPEEGTALAPGLGAVQATQAGDSAALLE